MQTASKRAGQLSLDGEMQDEQRCALDAERVAPPLLKNVIRMCVPTPRPPARSPGRLPIPAPSPPVCFSRIMSASR